MSSSRRSFRLVHLAPALVVLAVMGNLGSSPAAAQTAPPHCEMLGLQSCAEAGKPFSATVTVNNAQGMPVPGAQVIIGTGNPTTTNNGGQASISGNCGQAGSSVTVSVRIGGQTCATATVSCYNTDKDGNFVIPVRLVSQVGSSTIEKADLLAYSTRLTYAGIRFAGPEPETIKIETATEKLLDGRLRVNFLSYYAEYPPFEIGPLSTGPTVVTLKPHSGNYLILDLAKGTAYGALQTHVENALFTKPQERHMQFQGTISGDLLKLNLAGFLIEPRGSDAIHRLGGIDLEAIKE